MQADLREAAARLARVEAGEPIVDVYGPGMKGTIRHQQDRIELTDFARDLLDRIRESFMTCVANLNAHHGEPMGRHAVVIEFHDLKQAQELYSLLIAALTGEGRGEG